MCMGGNEKGTQYAVPLHCLVPTVSGSRRVCKWRIGGEDGLVVPFGKLMVNSAHHEPMEKRSGFRVKQGMTVEIGGHSTLRPYI